jgi:hypothetical protein
MIATSTASGTPGSSLALVGTFEMRVTPTEQIDE